MVNKSTKQEYEQKLKIRPSVDNIRTFGGNGLNKLWHIY